MSGRSVARSRGIIVGRGGGRGNNRSGRGSDSNGDGGNGSGSNYANMRDNVVEAARDGFDSAQPDVSNDLEISNVAPISSVKESHASNSTSKKLVNITPDQECFDDDGSANRAVTEIIKNMYRGAWPTWTSILTVHKCQMFDQFKVQMLTQTVEMQQREIEEMKKREETQRKELEDMKAKMKPKREK